MTKEAILFLACFVFFIGCSTQKTVQPISPLTYEAPISFLDEFLSGLPTEEKVEKVDERLDQRIEDQKPKAEEERREEKVKPEEKKVAEQGEIPLAVIPKLSAPPGERISLSDLAITDLYLKKKRQLFTTLVNVGTVPLQMDGVVLSLFVDGRWEGRYSWEVLSSQKELQPQESIHLSLPYSIVGRREVEIRVESPKERIELNQENNQFKKALEGFPLGPDIAVKDFSLTEDLDLSILLCNEGEVDLRRGGTFRVRIYVNDRKISDFEHYLSEELKAHAKTIYVLTPPYRIPLKGSSRVRVSLMPKLRQDDIFLENNALERRFIIFPFQLGGQGREQFSFLIPRPPSRRESMSELIKMELRWEMATAPLQLSFHESEGNKDLPYFIGRSPIRVEWPLPTFEPQRESHWMVSVTNLFDNRIEGHLIIQHP